MTFFVFALLLCVCVTYSLRSQCSYTLLCLCCCVLLTIAFCVLYFTQLQYFSFAALVGCVVCLALFLLAVG